MDNRLSDILIGCTTLYTAKYGLSLYVVAVTVRIKLFCNSKYRFKESPSMLF